MIAPPTLRTRRLSAELYARMHLDSRLGHARPSDAPGFSRRQAIARELQADGRFPTPRDPEPVPEVTVHDREHFQAASAGASQPVVLRGLLRDRSPYWEPRRLVQAVGDLPVTVMRTTKQDDARAWDVGIEHIQLPFDRFIERLPNERLYLNNSTELFVQHPELEAQLGLDRLQEFTDHGTDWDELLATNLFIGTDKVRSAIHAAWGGNFFVNLVGRKRWRFIAPEYSPYLNPVPARPFDYALSSFGGFAHCHENGEDDAIYFRLPWKEVVLEPGDVLYSAPWWWHEVENLTPITVATAVRHIQPPFQLTPSWRNNPAMAMGSRFPYSRAFLHGHYLAHRMGKRIDLRPHANRWIYQRLLKGFAQR